ncbi:hypothetical protein [Acinetobacter baumannii]|uniref:hypothetical protein n=1 Tax=Acinetobacter baumannii TaxID=470 RepID=UPI0016613773|nr:hypothetical protein [Acinetobacter baumannii]MBD0449063.1 hypothetical protein [Acinetobacter baumannii]MDB0078818.1 hypothetical protein [Acinetobacter baumannii]
MLKSILVLGTGIAIGMCMYKKKQKNSKSFSTDSDTDSLISKDNNKRALLHKPISKGLFHNIIFK